MNAKTEAWEEYENCRRELEREADSFGATGSHIYDNREYGRTELDTAVRAYAAARVAEALKRAGIEIVVEPDGDGFYAHSPTFAALHVGGATRAEAFHNALDGVWLCIDALKKDAGALADPSKNPQRRADYDLICGDCGGPHFLDCSLPSQVWNEIAAPEETLCPVCIDKRLQAKGMMTNEAEFYYYGKGLQSKLYQESHGEIAAAVREALADPLALIRDLVFWAMHTPSGGEYRKKREVLEAAALLAGKEDTHDANA